MLLRENYKLQDLELSACAAEVGGLGVSCLLGLEFRGGRCGF